MEKIVAPVIMTPKNPIVDIRLLPNATYIIQTTNAAGHIANQQLVKK